MKNDDVKKPPIFSRQVLLGATIVLLVLVFLASAILYPHRAEAEIVKAPPVKVLTPPAEVVVEDSGVTTEELLEVSMSEDVAMVKKRTLLITVGKDVGENTFTREGIDTVLEFFDNNGCVVIVDGDKKGLRHKSFLYTVSKTKCTLVQAITEYEEDSAPEVVSTQ